MLKAKLGISNIIEVNLGRKLNFSNGADRTETEIVPLS